MNILLINGFRDIKKQGISDQEGRGRKKKTSTKIDKAIITLFEKDERMTLKEAQRRLKRKGIEISIQTISKRLQKFLKSSIVCPSSRY